MTEHTTPEMRTANMHARFAHEALPFPCTGQNTEWPYDYASDAEDEDDDEDGEDDEDDTMTEEEEALKQGDVFLDAPKDLDWLFDVYVHGGPDLRNRTVCAIIVGSEDYPEEIQLYAVNHYQARPILTLGRAQIELATLKNEETTLSDRQVTLGREYDVLANEYEANRARLVALAYAISEASK